ncbi:MAG TPA: AtpZ/AtpI family protein [Vicinamibacteria bacterium]|nr:AtpZ/AtpI family protein [Vicinamibacteria bacterium]
MSATGSRGDWERALREAAPYLGIGTSLAVTVLAGLGIGYWVDGRFGTKPLGFLAGGVFGMVAAAYHFYKLLAVKKR